MIPINLTPTGKKNGYYSSGHHHQLVLARRFSNTILVDVLRSKARKKACLVVYRGCKRIKALALVHPPCFSMSLVAHTEKRRHSRIFRTRIFFFGALLFTEKSQIFSYFTPRPGPRRGFGSIVFVFSFHVGPPRGRSSVAIVTTPFRF